MPDRQQQETHLDDDQRASGGGLHYQQAFRDPEARVGVTPAAVGQPDAPSQEQRAQEYGGPAPADREILEEHGYPKLDRSVDARLTQVEHGPYAGGSQQGGPAGGEAGTAANDTNADDPMR